MKKILIVDNDYRYFLSHRLPIAKACLGKGWEVHLATPEQDQAVDQASQEGLTWHGVPLDLKSRNPVTEMKSVLGLKKLYEFLQPNLIHHLKVKPVLYGSVAARLAGVPATVNALTGLGYLYMNHNLKNRVIRPFVNQLFRYGFNHPNNRLILQNEDDKEMVLNYGLLDERNIEIIRGSGVNTEEYFYTSEDNNTIRVILPGRMLWDKGVGEFIEAAKKLKKEGIDATFHLYGDKDPKNPKSISQEQLNKWDQEPGIFYEGYEKDMVSIYREANIVCLPSYREGLPKSLLEAASTGRAIVTTDAPGCREIVEDGENGYLVPVRDVDILTERIKKLINEPELRLKFGQRSREKVIEHFAIEIVVEETLYLYEKFLSDQNTFA